MPQHCVKHELPKGRLGDRHEHVLNITEANRATIYVMERRASQIHELEQYMNVNYLSKGVRAVLYGVRLPKKANPRQLTQEHYFAVFVQDGFLLEVETE
jgi:hypothetical protein